jgi:hypothetical protein
MSKRKRIVLGTFAAVVVVAASSAGVARIAFERRLSNDVEDLLAASQGPEPTVVSEADLAGLPEPVQRWLRHAQVVGKQHPTTVRLKMEGQFRLGEDKGWMPFEAEEYYSTDPPGLVWTVSMKMAPLVSIVGQDRYIDGRGGIDMRLLGIVPVARKSGGSLDQGAMLRYLNEIMWFPAAALRPYIAWEGIDANSARATMSHGGVTASATFVFDGQGRLTTMTAERNNDAKGRPLPWSTPLSDYGEFEGVRVPIAGEAVWRYESGDFSYIRLRVTELNYNQPSRF